MAISYTVQCTCGWKVESLSSNEAVANWRQWHRRDVTPKGSRFSSDTVQQGAGHRFTTTKIEKVG